MGLRPLACWDRGFESHRGHGYLSVMSVVRCQIEVSASSRSLVQRSPIQCDREASIIRIWSASDCWAIAEKNCFGKKLNVKISQFVYIWQLTYIFHVLVYIYTYMYMRFNIITLFHTICVLFFFNVYMLLFMFNTAIYVFLLLCLCILIVCLCIFIVPTGTFRLHWLRFFRAFSSVVRQIPGYTSQRLGTVRTLPN
jgi:hypothetical protein